MLERRQGIAIVASVLAGGLGILPVAGGGPDPLACLAWLALIALATGAVCGALGIAPFPWGVLVPALWTFGLIAAELAAPRDLPRPAWGACAVGGTFLVGSALGQLAAPRPWPVAGAAALVTLALCALSLAGALAGDPPAPPAWLRDHPRTARVLVDVSPLVFTTECAGLDWVHAHPDVYALSGVEWFVRRPWSGPLAAPAWLVVGCVLSQAAALRARAARRSAEADEDDPPPRELCPCASTSARSPRS